MLLRRMYPSRDQRGGIRQSPGIGVVRGSPRTGRLRIHHDAGSSGEGTERCVREAVAVTFPQVPPTVTRASRHRLRGVLGRARGAYAVTTSMAAPCSAAAALTLDNFPRPPPLMRLGTIGVISSGRRTARIRPHTQRENLT
jgi:hypothetical protein